GGGERRVGVVAEELRERVFALATDATDVRVLETVLTGEELATRAEYLHPFLEYKGPILLADYVTTTDGTGLVHTAPGHGEDDFNTGLANGLPVYNPVLANGRFDDTAPEFIRGLTVWEANPLITQKLRDLNLLFDEVKIVPI